MPSINLSNIKRKILGKAENQTWGCWVRSKYATSVLSAPPQLFNFNMKVLYSEKNLHLVDLTSKLSSVIMKQVFCVDRANPLLHNIHEKQEDLNLKNVALES